MDLPDELDIASAVRILTVIVFRLEFRVHFVRVERHLIVANVIAAGRPVVIRPAT